MWLSDEWKDYEVIDTSSGEKLERWGKYILVRPDPQVIWSTPKITPCGANMMQNTAAPIPAAANGQTCIFPSSGRCGIRSSRST